MVKTPHEALHRIFQEDTTLFARAFERILGVDFPQPRTVSVINSDVTEMLPIERRLDTPLLVDTDDGPHVVIIESQSRPEESRRRSWPYYISYMNSRYACPVTLLVVTADKATAVWARKPIKTGLAQCPSQVTAPLVLAPDNVPAVQEAVAAGQDVMMAVLSALTHRNQPQVDGILEALAAALGQMEEDTAAFLVAFTDAGLGNSDAARIWRALMTTIPYPHLRGLLRTQWQEEGRIEGRIQGRDEGLLEGRLEGRLEEATAAVLRVLQTRGLVVSEAVESRIRDCTDLAEVEALHTRAVTAARAEDIFHG